MSNWNNNNKPQGDFQRRPSTMFNDFRYPMPASKEPVDGAKYPARLTFEMGLDGKIYFKVNDGVFGAQDRNAKLKEVHMSTHDRGALFGLIREACDNKDFSKAQYQVKQITFGQGGRLNDHASTLATWTVIRTPEGKICLGYVKGTYKVMFEFNSPFESVIMVSQDGEPTQAVGLMSRLYAISFIEHAAKFLDQYEWEQYKPRQKRDDNAGNSGGNGGNNNGNWNNNRSGGSSNQGGGNGGSRPPAPDSDFGDLDFMEPAANSPYYQFLCYDLVA